MKPLNLIILGASGFLGRNLVSHWATESAQGTIAVFALARQFHSAQEALAHAHARWLPIEAFEPLLNEMSAKALPSVVVNAVALADISTCEVRPQDADQANHRFAVQMALHCKKRQIPFVHISTDSLFPNDRLAGAPVYWSPSDETQASTVYAQTKLAAERGLDELNWGQCLRLSFVGHSQGTGRGLVAHLARCLREDRVIQGFTDNWFNPLHTQQLARFLLALAQNPPACRFAITHLGTRVAITKYEFLRQLLANIKQEREVLPVLRREMGQAARTSFDQSLKVVHPFSTEEMISLSAQSLREELR